MCKFRSIFTEFSHVEFSGCSLEVTDKERFYCCYILQIRSSVIRSLPAVELEDLPVIVKFLLQTVSSTEAQQVQYATNPGKNDHMDYATTTSKKMQRKLRDVNGRLL